MAQPKTHHSEISDVEIIDASGQFRQVSNGSISLAFDDLCKQDRTNRLARRLFEMPFKHAFVA